MTGPVCMSVQPVLKEGSDPASRRPPAAARGRGLGKAASVFRADAPVTEIGGLGRRLGRRQLDDPLMFR